MTDSGLRVLHLIRSLSAEIGGPVTYLNMVKDVLEGTSIAVVTGAPSGQSGLTLRSVIKFYRWLNGEIHHADVVHIHGIFGWQVMLGAWLCWKHKLPYVVSTHGNLHPYALQQKAHKKNAYLYSLGNRILNKAARIIATTPEEAGDLNARKLKSPITVLAPAIPVPSQPVADFHYEQKNGNFRAAFLGRLHPHKGIPLLFEALALLKNEGHEVEAYLAGSGDEEYKSQLIELAETLGVSSQVVYCGFLTEQEKTSLLKKSDALVLPSYSENFSFSAAEGMAAGLPAIVTETVGLASLIQSEHGGYVVPIHDSVAIAQAIKELTNLSLRRKVGARAHQCALRNFSLASMRPKLMALYFGIKTTLGSSADPVA